ncbi:MAG: contractile injection system protein, VgrG/Pvc8 family [Neisseria sp.]|nr:contractile injection system protein, VgrG/Pvc8 family [Neisseria sp.]
MFEAVFQPEGRHITPVALLKINGQNFGTLAQSRIIRVQLTDKRGFEADELTIELDDYDQSLAFPPKDSRIEVWLGYRESGVVYKGAYRVTELSWQGAPDTLQICAQAADMSGKLAEQQEKSWHKTSLKTIVETIAKQHGLTPVVGQNFQNEQIAHIDQTNESDAAFLSRLAERYDAIATVKENRLLFVSAGEATTANGTPMPEITLHRNIGDQYSYRYTATENYQAVRAYYTDKKTGKKHEAVISKDNVEPVKQTQTKVHKYKRKRKDGKTQKVTRKTVSVTKSIKTDGLKIKTLRHLYQSKATAENGARAAFKKLKRGTAEFDISLALGRPDVTPESPVTLRGFKAEIDEEQWVGVEVETTLDSKGLTGRIKLESLIDFAERSDEQP